MATPTLSTVAPAIVWTGGQMVTLTGTNFRPGTVPSGPSTGPYPAPNQTMRVTAGGVEATNVRVLSSTSLTCMLGAHDATETKNGDGSVTPFTISVTIQNLDNDGAAIPGESATLADAISYARPNLAAQGDFDRLNRAIIRLLKQQVIENVSQYVNTDYGETPFEVAHVGGLPALALSGANLDWSTAVFQGNSPVLVGSYPATTFQTRRRPIKVDVVYELSMIAEATAHMNALEPLIMQFFDRNRIIRLAKDPADPSQGSNRYDMFIPFGESVRNTTAPNSSNIRSAAVSFRIRAFGIEGIAGFTDESLLETGGIIDTVTLVDAVKV